MEDDQRIVSLIEDFSTLKNVFGKRQNIAIREYWRLIAGEVSRACCYLYWSEEGNTFKTRVGDYFITISLAKNRYEFRHIRISDFRTFEMTCSIVDKNTMPITIEDNSSDVLRYEVGGLVEDIYEKVKSMKEKLPKEEKE